MVLYGIYGLWGSDEHATLTRGLVLSLWLLHGLAVLGSLWLVSEDAPRFGFAPALSASAWLIFSCYVLERHWFPQFHVRRWVALMGLLSVGLALFFPGQALHWNASPWLPLHWVLGIASYGLLGAGVVHALVLSNVERRIRLALPVHEGLPLLTMERLTYRFVKAGFVLLSATLLVGGLFGDALGDIGRVVVGPLALGLARSQSRAGAVFGGWFFVSGLCGISVCVGSDTA
jgi:ABC-type uncharacterized transport system permease subunit